MASNSTKFDDPYGFARPVQNGPAQIGFPFRKNGDVATRIIQRNLIQRAGNYAPPLALGLEKDSIWPGGDPQAYQAAPDTDPVPLGIEDLVSFTRTYARIPAAQTIYPGSIYITLPIPENQYNNATSLVATDFEYNKSLGGGAYQGGALWSSGDGKLYRAKAVLAATLGRATAGTFTITYGANTTAALNYNDTGATISTAINGLASVSADGITVSATNNLQTAGLGYLSLGIALSGFPTGWPKKFTMNAGSLTVSTSNNPVTSVLNGNTQVIYLPDHLTVTSHGFNTSNRLAGANSNNRLVCFPSGEWGSIDTNTIWLPSSAAGYAFVGDYVRDYGPATRLIRSRNTENFYLPGVTAGITTPADIPVAAGLQNTDDFLDALITLSSWQTYRSDGPAPWLDGAIYRVASTAINLDDV